LSRNNLSLTPREDLVWPTLSDIYSAVKILVTLGGLATLIYGIRRIQPRVLSQEPVFEPYIDSKMDHMVEETEFRFSWGHVWPKKVCLPRLPRDCAWRIFYKPMISYKQILPPDQYEETAKGTHRTIVIVGKDFFDKAETRTVYVQKSTPTDLSYKGKLDCKDAPNSITIENRNLHEVHNYPIDLPSNVTLADLGALLEQIAEFRNPPEAQRPGKIRAVLRRIPAMQGETPGVVILSWRGTSALPS